MVPEGRGGHPTETLTKDVDRPTRVPAIGEHVNIGPYSSIVARVLWHDDGAVTLEFDERGENGLEPDFPASFATSMATADARSELRRR